MVCRRDPFWGLYYPWNDVLSTWLPNPSTCRWYYYLYCITDPVSLAIKRVQLFFHALQHSFINLRLILNKTTNITKCMFFFPRSKNSRLAICISILSMVQSSKGSQYKHLSISINVKFSFNHHIKNLAHKWKQKIGFLYRNKFNFPQICDKCWLAYIISLRLHLI